MDLCHLDNSDGDASDRTNVRDIGFLSCSFCDATNFSSRSKLNKHRNAHEKPYECLAENCSERFAQKQALDRHTQTKHGDTNNPAKYYHCTVDGCKYASTGGRRQKKFLRLDQVKEHIKDYGHYGPHSANDRRRRPGEPLFAEHVITARFEEWTLDESSNFEPRRAVKSCEFNSCKPKTNLWHTDDTAEGLILEGSAKADLYSCTVRGCYYTSPPPEGCSTTFFRTERGRQEHYRRSHANTDLCFSNAAGSQVLNPERNGSVSSLRSTEDLNYSLVPTSASLDMQDLLGSVGNHLSTVHVDEGNCSCLDCYLVKTTVSDHTQLDFCRANLGFGCYCESCCQRDGPTLSGSESVFTSTSQGGYSPIIQLQSIYHSQSLYSNASLAMSENTGGIKHFTNGSNFSGTTLQSRQSSIRSHTEKLSCTVRFCTKTFRRKGDLQRHLDTQHNSRFVSCVICERQFRRKDKLIEHVRKHSVFPESNPHEYNSGLSDYSGSSTFDRMPHSSFQAHRDVAPSDTLVTHSPSLSIGISQSPYSAPVSAFEKGSGLLGGIGEQWSASPRPIQFGTIEWPICVDEATPTQEGNA